MAAIGRLEDGAGVPDRPPRRRIRKIHIEQGDSSLRLLRNPGDPAIVRHQDGPYRPNRRPMPCGEKLNAVEGCVRLARLIDPMRLAVLRIKNGSVAADHPPLSGRHKREAVERHLGINELRMPGISPVLAPANRPIGSDDPSLLLIKKENAREARCSAADNLLPLLPAIDRLQQITGLKIKPVLALDGNIKEFVKKYAGGDVNVDAFLTSLAESDVAGARPLGCVGLGLTVAGRVDPIDAVLSAELAGAEAPDG